MSLPMLRILILASGGISSCSSSSLSPAKAAAASPDLGRRDRGVDCLVDDDTSLPDFLGASFMEMPGLLVFFTAGRESLSLTLAESESGLRDLFFGKEESELAVSLSDDFLLTPTPPLSLSLSRLEESSDISLDIN